MVFFCAACFSLACFRISAISNNDGIFGTQPQAHFGGCAFALEDEAICMTGGGCALPSAAEAHIIIDWVFVSRFDSISPFRVADLGIPSPPSAILLSFKGCFLLT